MAMTRSLIAVFGRSSSRRPRSVAAEASMTPATTKSTTPGLPDLYLDRGLDLPAGSASRRPWHAPTATSKQKRREPLVRR